MQIDFIDHERAAFHQLTNRKPFEPDKIHNHPIVIIHQCQFCRIVHEIISGLKKIIITKKQENGHNGPIWPTLDYFLVEKPRHLKKSTPIVKTNTIHINLLSQELFKIYSFVINKWSEKDLKINHIFKYNKTKRLQNVKTHKNGNNMLLQAVYGLKWPII